MGTIIKTLGDLAMAVVWPLLFSVAMLAIIVGRKLGFGEREGRIEVVTEG